ncbi:MAG: hypothetical protein CFE29_04595 [Bradyrhizobiaceae bacterium PARB1]|jgi:hypothetical protein|nr:MAG: hypothetical protein CFE29_04595 [Bradyrhizobiaceae bacterium PARB1]
MFERRNHIARSEKPLRKIEADAGGASKVAPAERDRHDELALQEELFAKIEKWANSPALQPPK